MAAVTKSARVENVNARGQRTVDYTCAFADGTAVTLTHADLGLRFISEVWIKSGTGTTGVDWSTDNTTITLDPVGAFTGVLRFVGSE